MLTVLYYDFILILNNFISLLFIWVFFFKLNNINFLLKNTKNDNRSVFTNLIKKQNYSVFIKFCLIITIFFLLNFFILHFNNQSFFFQHLYINFKNYKLILSFYIFNIFILYIFYKNSYNSIVVNIDYIFSIENIIIILPLIFFTNNFLSFFFFLEISSCLVFYKFVSSRIFYKNNLKFNNIKILEKFNKNLPKMYLNILFFQYWVTFFSSVIILFSFIQLIQIFSSTE